MIEWVKLEELIKTRRSIRKFQDKEVPEDLLLKALEAATWAPNGGNHQAWRFLIVKNSDFFRRAPFCIAVLMGKFSSIADRILQAREEMDPLAREIRSYRRLGSSGLQSIAAAITYLLLILHYFGLGATWMGGPQQAKKEIEALLDVPPEWDFVALIPVGYPAETPKIPPRKPIREVVQFFR